MELDIGAMLGAGFRLMVEWNGRLRKWNKLIVHIFHNSQHTEWHAFTSGITVALLCSNILTHNNMTLKMLRWQLLLSITL